MLERLVCSHYINQNKDTSRGLRMLRHVHTLDNGTRIIAGSNTEEEGELGIYVDVDSSLEDMPFSGQFHIYAAMFEKKMQKYEETFSDTGHKSIFMAFDGKSYDYEDVLTSFAQSLLLKDLKFSEFYNAKALWKTRLTMRKNLIENKVDLGLYNAAFNDGTYARHPMNNIEEFKKIEPQDIERYMNSVIYGENIVIYKETSKDLDNFIKVCQEALSAIPSKDMLPRTAVEILPNFRSSVTKSSSYFMKAMYQGPLSCNEDDFVSTHILASIFNERYRQIIDVHKKGIGVMGMDNVLIRDRLTPTLNFNAKVDHTQGAYDMLRERILNLSYYEPSYSEFNNAIELLKEDKDNSDSKRIDSDVARQWIAEFVGSGISLTRKFLCAAYQDLTPKKVRMSAQELFGSKPALSEVGDTFKAPAADVIYKKLKI
jgi:hypothetical protein